MIRVDFSRASEFARIYYQQINYDSRLFELVSFQKVTQWSTLELALTTLNIAHRCRWNRVATTFRVIEVKPIGFILNVIIK